MFENGPSRSPFAESPRDSSEQVRISCHETITRELSSFYARLNSGALTEDDVTTSYIFLDKIDDAAKTNNIQELDQNIDVLFRVPGVYDATLARACLTGAAAGSRHAFDMLSGALDAERRKAAADTPALRQRVRSDIVRAYAPTGLLDSVVEVCAERGIPAERWIQDYAYDKEHSWRQHMRYYGQAAKMNPASAPLYSGHLNATAAQLVDDKSFCSEFVYGQTLHALQGAHDPALRDRLVRRFMQTCEDVPVTPSALGVLVSVGNAVVRDPHFATNDNVVTFFAHMIEHRARLLQDAGMDIPALTAARLPWMLSLERRDGGSPQRLISVIDVQIGQLLSTNMPDTYTRSGGLFGNRESVSNMRDGLLVKYAREYAEQGDFTIASSFISAVAGESRLPAFQGLLEFANTSEQIAALKPDDFTLAVNPGLHTQFMLAQGIVKSDVRGLAGLAVECARTIDDSNEYTYKRSIALAYELVASQDKQRAVSLARQLLSVLRNNRVGYGFTSQYSDILIEAGDPDEPSKALEDINRPSTNERFRLVYTWRLARKLGGVAGC